MNFCITDINTNTSIYSWSPFSKPKLGVWYYIKLVAYVKGKWKYKSFVLFSENTKYVLKCITYLQLQTLKHLIFS